MFYRKNAMCFVENAVLAGQSLQNLHRLSLFVHNHVNAVRQCHLIDILVGGSHLASVDVVDVHPFSDGVHFVDSLRVVETDGNLVLFAVDIIRYDVDNRPV